MSRHRFDKKAILWIYFIYRMILMLFSVLVVARMTTLGDSGRYLSATLTGSLKTYGYLILVNGIFFTDFFTALVKSLMLGSAFLTHLVFNLLGFIGVKLILDELEWEKSSRFNLFILLIFFPSFNIWSGVVGKEAIILFCMGVLVSEIIRYFKGKKLKFTLLAIFSLYILLMIKIQYIPAILQLVIYIKLTQRFRPSVYIELMLIMAIIAMNILILYILRDYIDVYSRMLTLFYDVNDRSTRPNPFVKKYDIFRLMPYGLFIGFWGPTVRETKISILHMFTFFESMFLVVVLLIFLKRTVYSFLIQMKLQFRRLFIVLNTMFWILFAQYVQGILNPGSAIRYRTNFYMLMLCLLYFIYERNPIRGKLEATKAESRNEG